MRPVRSNVTKTNQISANVRYGASLTLSKLHSALASSTSPIPSSTLISHSAELPTSHPEFRVRRPRTSSCTISASSHTSLSVYSGRVHNVGDFAWPSTTAGRRKPSNSTNHVNNRPDRIIGHRQGTTSGREKSSISDGYYAGHLCPPTIASGVRPSYIAQ